MADYIHTGVKLELKCNVKSGSVNLWTDTMLKLF
jgi:hypothetical protein